MSYPESRTFPHQQPFAVSVFSFLSNPFSDFVFATRSLLIIFGSLFLLACHPTKKLRAFKPLNEEKAEVLESRMDSARIHFDWLSARISANTNINGKTNSFTVSLRMRSDSVMWMSISALGIEAARVLVTKDSVKLMDRLNSKFAAESFSYVNQAFPFPTDFEVLESLLIGKYFSYLDARKLRSSYVDSSLYILSTLRRRTLRRQLEDKEPNRRIIEDVWLDPQSFRIVRLSVDDNKLKKKLTAQYDNFIPVEYGSKPDTLYFPALNTYEIESDKPVNISLEFSKIVINKEQEFPFTIPEKYERMK